MARPAPFGGNEMLFITRAAAAAVLGAALIAATGAALMAGPAPAAFAASGPGATGGQGKARITVQPDPAAPNEPVRVFDGGQCAIAAGTASSMGFSAPAALRRSGRRLTGRTSIRSGALGTYPVIVECGKREVSGSVRVVKTVAAVKSHRPAAVMPKGAASTGDGTTSRGYDAAMAKAGLAVVGVGAVAGLVARRRRRSRSRT